MKVDNFAITLHQGCPGRYDLRINECWTRRVKSAPLTAGGGLHAGLAEWYKTGSLESAVLAIKNEWPAEFPAGDYRSLGKVVETMIEYTKIYPSEPWTVVGAPDHPLIEVSFTLDTGLMLTCFDCREEPVDGVCPNCHRPCESIQYGGIFDGLIEAGPHIYLLEHKTTSQLGGAYFKQFKPDNQLTGYIWAAKKLSGKRVGGGYINAIGWYKTQRNKYERNITTRTSSEIAWWLVSLKASCEEIQEHRRTGIWPWRTSSCMLYGACEYHDVHVLPDERSRQLRLEQDYVKSDWDYENRD